MAFCLRALLGPGCRYCRCQPPGTPAPGALRAQHSPGLVALRAAHLHLPLAGSWEASGPWFPGVLIFPTLGAPSLFPRRGFLPPFLPEASCSSCLWAAWLVKVTVPCTLASSQEQTMSVHVLGEVGSLQRPGSRGRGPWLPTPRAPHACQHVRLVSDVPGALIPCWWGARGHPQPQELLLFRATRQAVSGRTSRVVPTRSGRRPP